MDEKLKNIKDYLPRSFNVVEQTDTTFKVAYGPYTIAYDEADNQVGAKVYVNGEKRDYFWVGRTPGDIINSIKSYLARNYIEVKGELPTMREVLPDITRNRAGDLKKYFHVPCVVAYAKTHGLCVMIIRKKLGSYHGVRCTTGYGSATDRIGLKEALEEIEDIIKSKPVYQELPDEDKQKIVAEMI